MSSVKHDHKTYVSFSYDLYTQKQLFELNNDAKISEKENILWSLLLLNLLLSKFFVN